MEIQKFEENKKIKPAFNKILKNYLLCRQYEHESFYLLDKLIECSFIEPYIFKDIAYFIHRFPKKGYQIVISDKFHRKIAENYEELSKNDWELHKKLIEEGVNPNEIAKMIRNNEIEKLQEISSQPNFDFNQTIEPSLYERCSFISQSNVTLIDYAAFFSSVKCFKYLLMNGANVYNAGKYAVAGGNLEIIHLCQQNHVSFKDAYETAIQFHKNNIFKYLYENKILIVNSSEKLGAKCIKYYNYELFTFLEKEGMDVTNYIINKTAKIGNLYLVKYFLHNHQIPNDIIVSSIKSQNIELIKFLLMQKGFDINAKNIYLFYLLFISIFLYF